MNVILSQVTKDKTHFNKSMNNQITKICTLIEPYNLREPRIILTYDPTILTYNYASITIGTKTYHYYIMDKTIEKHNCILDLHIDSLHTYANEIKSSPCHITRSSVGSKMIVDDMAKRLEGSTVITRNLGTGLTGSTSYIMIKGK